MIKILLSSLILTFFGTVPLLGQAILLEAQVTGVGMVSPQGERLYVRIYDNGKYEYEDEETNASGLRTFIREGRLSKLKLEKLASFIKVDAIQDLPRLFESKSASDDHRLELRLAIRNSDHYKRIRLVNFSSNKYVENQLIELLCMVEEVRLGASFQVDPQISRRCRK